MLLVAGMGINFSANLMAATPNCTPPPSGLVGWWPAEGNGLDSVGTNNGTLLNGASFISGKVGQAFLFGTTNAGVKVPASATLDVGLSSGFTVEGWINPSNLSIRGEIAEWNNGDTNQVVPYGVHLQILSPGELGLGAGNLFSDVHGADGQVHWIMAPGGTITTNTFQHVALTYAKTTGIATLYCNGVVVAQQNLGSFTPLTSYDFYIGRRPAAIGSVHSFSGSIDELSVYNRALSTNEIASIYAASSAGKCTPQIVTCTPTPSGLVAWWPGEASALDAMNTNNGTPQGNLTYTNGLVGMAFNFNATNSDVKIPASPTLNVGLSSGFTLESWINVSNTAARTPIFEWNNNAGNWGVHFWVSPNNTGELYANIVDSGGGWHSLSSAAGLVQSGVYKHVALTYDKTSGVAKIYLNGNVVAQQSIGSVTPLTSYDLYLGRRVSGASGDVGAFVGIMDEPSIYNRALATNEIKAIYNAGSAGKCTPTLTPPLVTLQPSNQTVATGSPVTFSVAASGSTPLSYQWRFNGTNLLGATNSSYSIATVQTTQAGNYTVLVSNAVGSTNSATAVLTVTAISPGCTPPAGGLISWWPGEGSAADIVGPNNGTLSSSGASYTTGLIGQAFRFDGTNGYVQIPDAPALKPTNVTVEAWVWLDPALPANRGGEQIIFKKNTWSAWFEGYSLLKITIDNGNGTYSDRFQFCVSRSGNQVAINSITIAQRGVWYHVAATYDGNKSILYVNGVAEASATPGFALDYDTTPIYIGTSGTWSPYLSMFGGIIDEPSIYNRALATNEIVAIYQAGSAGKCAPTAASCVTPPTGMVGWWPAEGNAVDIVGGINGLMTNGATVAAGEVGQAFNFNGVNQFVKVPQSSAINSFGNQVTIEFWMKANPSNSMTTMQGLVATDHYGVEISNGFGGKLGLNFFVDTGNGSFLISSANGGGIQVPPGVWHHVAGVYDGSKLQLFIDGLPAGNFANASGIITPMISTSYLSIGSDDGRTYCGCSGRYFWGLIDEVSLYNRALSTNEIAAIYNAGSAGKCVPAPSSPTIIQQPTNKTVTAGLPVSFSVVAAGSAPLSYQWLFNSIPITGATNSIYTIAAAQPTQAGSYAVVVSNPAGSTNSATATLAVLLQVPVITNFSPKTGTNGTVVMLTGTNFSPVASNNIVYFGAVRAVVTAASTTTLTVTVPTGATHAPITATVNGLVAYSGQLFEPTFLGNGSGITSSSFGPRLTLAAGNNAYRVIVADIDGDGKPDLIVGNVFGNSISLYRNISTGGLLTTASFAPRIDIATPAGTYSPFGLAVADVDGDGKLDILTADYSANMVSIYRNISTPGNISSNSFATRVDLATSSQPQGLEVRDIDGDGRPDLLVANVGAGTLSIYRNIGAAGNLTTNTFAPKIDITTGSGCSYIVVGDLNGDGKPDVVTANGGNSTLSILRNISSSGSIAFAPIVNLTVLSGPNQLAIGDLDGDGKLDLTVACYLSQALSVFRNTSTNGSLTTSSFAPRIDYSLGGRGHTPTIADLDGDGKPDVAVVTELSSLLSVFRNISTPGSFTNGSLAARADFSTGSNPWSVTAGDLDGDGRPDIIFCNQYDSTISIYQNQVPFGGLPVITAQPANQTVIEGDAVSFRVTATGLQPFTYQWRFNGNAIADATNGFLALNNVQLAQAGNYSVTVANAAGSVTSSNATLTVITPECTTAAPGLVAWWQAEGNANDIAGTNNGALIGSTSYTSGKVGQAFSFNGASYVQVSDAPALHFTNAMTVEAWVNLRTFSGANSREIVSKIGGPNSDPGSYTFSIDPATKTAYFIVANGGSYAVVYSATTIPTNQWTHLAGTYDGSTVKIYVNGQLAGSTPWTQGIFTGNNNPLVIGCTLQYPNPTSFFNGLIDEVSLYNRALSTNEIAAIYAARGAGKCPLPPLITKQPASQTVIEGDAATFNVLATGTGPLTYQWFFKGNPIPSGTNSSLALSDTKLSQAGNYSVTVANAFGSVNSSNATLSVLVPTCTPAPSGLVAWWPAEGNGLDSVGTNNGTLLNGASFISGKVGQAFLFGTTNAGVKIPASPALDVGFGTGMTVEGWINPTDLSKRGPIVEWNNGNTNLVVAWGVHLQILRPDEFSLGSGNLFADVHGADGQVHWIMAPGGTITSNKFQHVALTYDKTTGLATLYRNGSVVAQSYFGQFTPLTTYDFYIGRRPAGDGTLSFPGAIDEVSVYNRALSTNEIQAIYAARGAGKCPLPPTVLNVTPTNWYVNEGATVSYTATAVGSPTLTYQWQHIGADIAGATNATLTLSGVVYAQAGNYAVVVSNPGGITTSSNVVLRVNRAPIADASASESLVISPNGTNATVVLDGSRSSDPDGDALTYAWFHTGDASPFATGTVAIGILPTGTNQLTLTVNDGMASGSQNFVAEVITTSQAIDRLIELVKSKSVNLQPLIASLRAALAAIDRSQPDVAINQLEAFINKVHAQLEPLDPVLAAQLIADAQAIIDALTNGSTVVAAQVEITTISHDANGKAHLKIKGINGRFHVIETSTNMVDWIRVGVATRAADGSYEFDDAQLPNADQRYYRIVSPK